MLKWLLTIAVVYLIFRWYKSDQKSRLIRSENQKKLSDDDYIDYEEVE